MARFAASQEQSRRETIFARSEDLSLYPSEQGDGSIMETRARAISTSFTPVE
jgi:hypothetical protein